MTIPFDCVIPAAGLSSRMGAFKPLATYRGAPLLTHAVNNALTVCRRVIVVTGYRSEEVVRLLAGRDRVHTAWNENYRDGMVSSVARGAAEVESEFFFVAPGDMPKLDEAVFRRVVEAARATGTGAAPSPATGTAVEPSPAAYFPVYAGRRGHPVLISRAVVPALLRKSGAVSSVREFLADYTVAEVPLSVPDRSAGIFFDVDTVEDLSFRDDTDLD